MTEATLPHEDRETPGGVKDLPLEPETACWQVTGGVVNVFAVYVRAGSEDGRRLHLCEFSAGQIFFGLAPIPCLDGAVHFIASGQAGAAVKRCDDLMAGSIAGNETLSAAFDFWVEQLLRSLGVGSGKWVNHVKLKDEALVTLPAGTEIVAQDRLLWVEPASGRFCYSQLPSLLFEPGDKAMPLSYNVRMHIVDKGTQLKTSNTGQYFAVHGQLPDLTFLIDFFRKSVAEAITKQQEAERQEILQRIRQDSSLFSGSLQKLAQPLLAERRSKYKAFSWSNLMRREFLFWAGLSTLVLICLVWFGYLASTTVRDWRFRRKAAHYRAEYLASYQGPIRVGVASLNKTRLDNTLWQGIDFAAKEINASGGVLGRKIELVFRDDHNTIHEARKIAQEFSEDMSMTAVIGHRFSPVSLATAMIYEYYGLLMLCPRVTSPKLTQQGYRRVFRTNINGNMLGSLMADFARKKGFKRVAMMYLDDDFGKGYVNAFEQRADELEIAIVDRLPHNMEITNKELHDKMAFWRKNLSFDAVILVTLMQYGPQIIRIARDEGLDEPMILSESLDSSELITRVGGGDRDLANLYIETLYHPDAPYKAAGEFNARYIAAYGERPTGLAAQGYDSLYLLAHAIKMAGSLVPDRIADKLREVRNLEGVTGPQTILPDGDMIKPLMFQTIRDGKFVYHATEGGGTGPNGGSGTDQKDVRH